MVAPDVQSAIGIHHGHLKTSLTGFNDYSRYDGLEKSGTVKLSKNDADKREPGFGDCSPTSRFPLDLVCSVLEHENGITDCIYTCNMKHSQVIVVLSSKLILKKRLHHFQTKCNNLNKLNP